MTTLAPTTDTDPSTAKPKRAATGLLRVIGLVFGAVACGGAGFGAGWYMFSSHGSPMSEALRLIDRGQGMTGTGTNSADGAGSPLQRTPRPMPDSTAFVTSYYTFDEPLTTNPAGSRRFVQLGVSLSTQYDAKVMAHVDTHKVALRSDMLAVIGSFSEDQMTGPEGRESLATALRDAINARLEALEGFGGIEGVYFPSFVVQ